MIEGMAAVLAGIARLMLGMIYATGIVFIALVVIVWTHGGRDPSHDDDWKR